MQERKHKRFTPRQRAYLTSTWGDWVGLAERREIVDMSMGGAALKYVPKEEPARPGQNVFLEIYGVSMSYVVVEKIRCRVVYDIPLSDSPISTVRLRRCGLEFIDLTPLQSYLIGHYIKLFSSDEKADTVSAYEMTS
ncbi:MAG: PilZ domain-containing protein [Candidatus Aminicenantes bacterium]|nr:PilZ domain-containing protein [Candidatus Aminicenantes bacterium]